MNHVEVWVLDRSAPHAASEVLEALLSPEERGRRDRLRRPQDQDRFRLGRALCRTVLARCLGRPAAGLELQIGPHGRPGLADALDGPWFSISHSGDLVVLAVAPVVEVGLDVEWEDPALDPASLAATVCTSSERAALARLPADDMRREFHALWTLKEAFAKATGLGLGLDPTGLGFDLERPGLVERLEGLSATQASAWRFQLWRPRAGYSLALAVRPTDGADLEICGPLPAAGLFET